MEENLKQEAGHSIRVVLFGPESTGKTTLARELAEYYNTQWVPEYMRTYLQEKWDQKKQVCTYEDLLPIAIGQMKWENEIEKKANQVLFCDTNLLEIKVYSAAYYQGKIPEVINKISLENVYDLYLLTYIDTPWEADDLRDKPDEREAMFLLFEDVLNKYKLPYVRMEGSKEDRLKKAVEVIDQLIKKKSEYSG